MQSAAIHMYKHLLKITFIAVFIALSACAPRLPHLDARSACTLESQGVAASSLWYGLFHGGKDSEGALDSIAREYTYQRQCFRAESDCRAWLYALNTEYQMWPVQSVCQLGAKPR